VCSRPDEFERIEAAFRQCGLRVRSRKQVKSEACVTCTWQASGSPQNHDRLVQTLMSDADVREFHF